MGGMGVVQDPGVLGDLGTVVKLQESTSSVPQGPVRLIDLFEGCIDQSESGLVA